MVEQWKSGSNTTISINKFQYSLCYKNQTHPFKANQRGRRAEKDMFSGTVSSQATPGRRFRKQRKIEKEKGIELEILEMQIRRKGNEIERNEERRKKR